MPVLLFNAVTQRLEKLSVRAAPFQVGFEPSFRARTLAGPVAAALSYLGYPARVAEEAGCDIFLGVKACSRSPNALWLKVGATEGLGENANAAWLCLKARYGEVLKADGPALARAGQELAFLRGRLAELAGLSLAPNEGALSNYSQKLRQALSQDLDFPKAAACLEAALRPGALSPGTQRAFLYQFLTIAPLNKS